MNRLFTFGCSYTYQLYPTWADLLSNSFTQSENWGKAGMGNRGIFNRVNQAILEKNINKDDTVVVQWSTPIREDRWIKRPNQYRGGWISGGNIYNQSYYPRDWVKKYFDPFMGLMETVHYIHACQHLLNSIGCKWVMFWMSNLGDTNKTSNWGEVQFSSSAFMKYHNGSIVTTPYSELCDSENLLKASLDKINEHPNMIKQDMQSYNNHIMSFKSLPQLLINGGIDGHPNTLVHYYFLKDFVVPMLSINNFDENSLFELAEKWTNYTSSEYWNIDSESQPDFTLTSKHRSFVETSY
jgi:hypothetical protein